MYGGEGVKVNEGRVEVRGGEWEGGGGVVGGGRMGRREVGEVEGEVRREKYELVRGEGRVED